MEIFDTNGFFTKSHCGPGWTDSLILLSQTSSFIIIIGYLIIAIEKYIIYKDKRNQIPRTWAFRLLILFPLICGISRLNNLLSFWWAPYRFYIICDWLCGIVTILLAFQFRYIIEYLINIIPYYKQIESNETLKKQIQEKQDIQEELEISNAHLKNVVNYLQTMIESEIWLHDRKETLMELSILIANLQKDNTHDSKL
jgi:hypothetical protein